MTEYTKLKLIDKAPDPAILSDVANNSTQFEAFKDKARAYTLVRDGNVVTITSVKTKRALEVPWSSVLWARPVEAKAEAAKTTARG